MKMYDLKNAETALQKLVNADLPIKIAFGLSNVVDAVDEQLRKFEEFRVNLIKKYGKETEKGFEVQQEHVMTFEKELNELLQLDIDIKDINPINLDLLENSSFSIVELKSLQNLGFISTE